MSVAPRSKAVSKGDPSFHITTPVGTGPFDVVKLEAECAVCVVGGDVDPGTDSVGNRNSVDTIYLAAKDDSVPAGNNTDEIIQWVMDNYSDSFTPNNPSQQSNWTRNQTVLTLNDTGPHRITGVAFFSPYDPMGELISPVLADHVWIAKDVDDCSKSKVAGGKPSAPVATTIAPTIDVIPIAYCDGWMRYTLFDENTLRGNRLCVPSMGGSIRLKASHILLAAAHILWKPTADSHQILEHPCGIPEIDDYEKFDFTSPFRTRMRFPKLARYSVVLYQSDQTTVITSECRDRPQQVPLNPEADIYVQLNTVMWPPKASEIGENIGAVEIWVKRVC